MRRFLLLLLLFCLIVTVAVACGRKAAVSGKGLEGDQLRSPAEWLRQEAVRLLYDYVRIDTRREVGEQEGAEFLRRFFECDGISTEIVCPVPRRCNLLVRLPGEKREGALLLLNHIDVAPFFAEMWKEAQPFEGKIKLGYLYGRGAYDMKSLAIAQALALRHLKRAGIVPHADILFLAEADEELGQQWGSRWLLDHRREWFQGVEAVLNEGGDAEMILREVRFWGIENVQAGYGIVELEADSRDAFQALAEKWRKIPSETVVPLPEVVFGFDMLANHLVHPLTDPLRHLDRVRQDPAALAALPDRYAAFLETRIKWFGPFKVPSSSTLRGYAVVSTPPGISPDPYVDSIMADAKKRGLRLVESFSSGKTVPSPLLTARGALTPFVELIKRVTEAHYPGVPFGPIPTFGGSTTSNYFRDRGIPAYGYPSVPANITDSVRRHANDERIFLRDYLNGVDLYRDIVEEFALSYNSSAQPANK